MHPPNVALRAALRTGSKARRKAGRIDAREVRILRNDAETEENCMRKGPENDAINRQEGGSGPQLPEPAVSLTQTGVPVFSTDKAAIRHRIVTGGGSAFVQNPDGSARLPVVDGYPYIYPGSE